MLFAYPNVDAKHTDAVAPFYRPDEWGRSPPAFLQLDLADGEISFGSSGDGPLFGPDLRSGRFIRWDVAPELRGDRLETLVQQLMPFMKLLLQGAHNIGDDESPQYVLDERAQSARSSVEDRLTGLDPVAWMADIREVADIAADLESKITADTTDQEIAVIVAEAEDDLHAEHITLTGSLSEFLREVRTRSR